MQILVPIVIFTISAFLSISILPAALVSFLIGIGIIVFLSVRKKYLVDSESSIKSSNVMLKRSAIALMLAPITVIAFVFIGMSGMVKLFPGTVY